MNRTEQETRIETILFDLIKNAGNMLQVQFISKDYTYNNGEKYPTKSIACKQGLVVKLTLIEPITPIELDQFGEAIIMAETLIKMVENERIYECQNPNFYKAIYAKFNHLNYK